ncbi:MAG: hypothetical protein ACTSWY_09630, partial [Promethearchaeota archaeon]
MQIKERNLLPLSEKNIKLRIALVYPNRYIAGMSGYTVHLLYSMFNNYQGIRCERFFLPEKTTLPFLKEDEKREGMDSKILRSIETGSSLSDFDVIAITLQYELDYLNILWIIDTMGIPFKNSRRAEYSNKIFPLLIAGGPCVFSNPLPLMSFIDIFIFGDIEPIFNRLMDLLLKYLPELRNFNSIVKEYIEKNDKNLRNGRLNSRNNKDLGSQFITELISLPNLLI